MKKVLFIIGTRPEALKMAPVIKAFSNSEQLEILLCTTGQHDSLLDQALKEFDLKVDHKINLPARDGNLSNLSSILLQVLDKLIVRIKPDYLFVHGDTATSYNAALAGFHLGVEICHVEAGLRTYDLQAPFPEEGYRQLTARLASYHYAPTDMARKNLLNEGINKEKIIVTGNTIVDALHQMIESTKALTSNLSHSFNEIKSKGEKIILVTVHRRENHTTKLNGILDALIKLSTDSGNAVVFISHPNPELKKKVTQKLKGSTIKIIDPLPYSEFISAMSSADLILTDSGGIQEEAPSLNTQVLVLRDATERPEGAAAGFIKVIGTNAKEIVSSANAALKRGLKKGGPNPYGDGTAAQRILDHFLSL